MDGDRLEDVVGALINVGKDAAVAPDFGVEGRPASVENSHDGPRPSAEGHFVSHRQARIRARSIAAGDQFGKAGAEHAALDDLDHLAHGEDVGGNATNLHIRVRTRRAQREGRHHHYFRGHHRHAIHPRHARLILKDFHGIQGDAAHHFGSGPGAHHDGIVSRTGRNQRGAEPSGQREHGDKHPDGAGNAQHGDDGGSPPRLHAAKVVDNGDGHSEHLWLMESDSWLAFAMCAH